MDGSINPYFNYLEDVKVKINNTVSFVDWADRWLHFYKKNYVKQSTYVESYKRTVDNYLLPHFSDCNIREITPIDIREYL